jgi:hypothetical protein
MINVCASHLTCTYIGTVPPLPSLMTVLAIRNNQFSGSFLFFILNTLMYFLPKNRRDCSGSKHVVFHCGQQFWIDGKHTSRLDSVVSRRSCLVCFQLSSQIKKLSQLTCVVVIVVICMDCLWNLDSIVSLLIHAIHCVIVTTLVVVVRCRYVCEIVASIAVN